MRGCDSCVAMLFGSAISRQCRSETGMAVAIDYALLSTVQEGSVQLADSGAGADWGYSCCWPGQTGCLPRLCD